MSWDVLVFNYDGSPPKDFNELPADSSPDPLGPAINVRDAINKYLPGVDWSDPSWGTYEDNELSIEFNAGKGDPIREIMLHVRGGGDAIEAILRFANPNKWSIFDCSTGEFIDPENPSQDGWEGFQKYRDNLIEHHDQDRDR